MNIAIIGAGIGGLVAALQLHAHGYQVTIYEATQSIEALGVGINLQPNAVEVLANLGLLEHLLAEGVTPETMAYYSTDGTLIFQESRGENADYAYPQISIHRGKLQNLLYRTCCQRFGAEHICFDHQLTHFTEHAKHVTLHFGTQTTQQTDLLVGADGIGSITRKGLHPYEGKLQFEGIRMWRGTTQMPCPLDGKTVLVCGSPSVQLVLYPLSLPNETGTCLMNWVVEILDPNATTLHADLWNHKSDQADFIDYFSEWDLPFIDLNMLFNHATLPIMEYPMVDRDPLPHWSTQYITLLGDAAHPMYPRGGNGATQAIIDAQALAKALNTGHSIPDCLAQYEQARRPVTANVVQNNRQSNQTKFFAWFEENCRNNHDRQQSWAPPAWFTQKAQQYHRDAGLEKPPSTNPSPIKNIKKK